MLAGFMIWVKLVYPSLLILHLTHLWQPPSPLPKSGPTPPSLSKCLWTNTRNWKTPNVDKHTRVTFNWTYSLTITLLKKNAGYKINIAILSDLRDKKKYDQNQSKNVCIAFTPTYLFCPFNNRERANIGTFFDNCFSPGSMRPPIIINNK